jgi:hypothetical protein
VGDLGLAGDADRVRAGLRRRLPGVLDTVDRTYNVLVEVGWMAIVPALLDHGGTTVLGITSLVRGSAPLLPALLLALVIPLAWLILQAISLGNAVLPVMFAFAILGRRLASGSAVADLPAAETPAR